MDEFNFEKVKSFEVPDEWAEKTIKNAKIYRINMIHRKRKIRIAVLCICFIIMCVMSLTFCLKIIGEAFIVPVNTDEIPNSPTSPKSYNNSIFMVEKTEEVQSNTADETTEENTLSTEDDEKSSETGEVVASTQENDKKEKATEKPTTSKKPSKKPASQKPTTKPQKPEYNDSVVEPTEAPIEDRVICATTINKSVISENDTIYCRIYSCDEDVYLGDSDLYSAEHLAEIYSHNDDKVYVRYFPVKNGVIKENGEYIVMMYDENGKNLKTFGYTVNLF